MALHILNMLLKVEKVEDYFWEAYNLQDQWIDELCIQVDCDEESRESEGESDVSSLSHDEGNSNVSNSSDNE